MTDRTYAISGAGFTLQGTIDAERIDLLMRLLDKVARDLALAPAEIGAQKIELEPENEI